jgi:hypothetical protein
MKRIDMYETQDGERFDSAEAAADHEAHLDDMAAVEAYLATQTWERGQETRARGILQGFVAYQRAAAMARLDQIAAPTQDQIAATGGPDPMDPQDIAEPATGGPTSEGTVA